MAEIQTWEREGIVLLEVSGSMSGSAAAKVTECLAGGTKGVVLNLEQATYIDSTWLGAIIQTFGRPSQSGGQLRLLNVPPKIMDLFVTTKLSILFDIFTSEDDAVNSFFPSRSLRYPRLMRDGGLVSRLSQNNRSQLTVFLCHSSSDKPIVRELRLRFLSVRTKPWLDELDLHPGQVPNRRRRSQLMGSKTSACNLTLSTDCPLAQSEPKRGHRDNRNISGAYPDKLQIVINQRGQSFLLVCNRAFSRHRWLYVRCRRGRAGGSCHPIRQQRQHHAPPR